MQSGDWSLWLFEAEKAHFDQSALDALIAELPPGISRVGLQIKDGPCRRWSARLLRQGQQWQPDDPGEALCDDLLIQADRIQTHEQVLVTEANKALEAWDQEKAADILQRGLGEFPQSPALLYLYSCLLSARNQLPECRQTIQQVLAVWSAEEAHPWSIPEALFQEGYLDHLLILIDYWSGNDTAAAAGLAATGTQVGLPDRPRLLEILHQSEALLAEPAAALETLAGIESAAGNLPSALQELARRYVPALQGFPELGSLACHHLDFIVLARLYPDRLLSRLLYARALCQLQLGQDDEAMNTLSTALSNPMASPGKMAMVLGCFREFLSSGPPGDVVELGCNQGSTSLALQMLIRFRSPERTLHVYDSFEGLPPPLPEDGATPYGAGSCTTARETFVTRFQAFGVPLPEIHQGWFSQTLPRELPEKMGFAYLDGDFYSSILESLEAIYPRLAPGAIVVIDDYGAALLPGVVAACQDFFKNKPEQIEQIFLQGVEALGRFSKL